MKQPKVPQSGNAYAKWNLTTIIKNHMYSPLWAQSTKSESDQEETADKPKWGSILQNNWPLLLKILIPWNTKEDLGTIPDETYMTGEYCVEFWFFFCCLWRGRRDRHKYAISINSAKYEESLYNMLYKKTTKELTKPRDSSKTAKKSKLSKALSLVPLPTTLNFQLPHNYPLIGSLSMLFIPSTGNKIFSLLTVFWLLGSEWT